jgi:hypothetical protein
MKDVMLAALLDALLPLGIAFITIVSSTLVLLLKRLAAKVEEHFAWLELRDDVDDFVYAAEETLHDFVGSDRYKWVLEKLQVKYPTMPVEKLDVLIQASVSAAPGLGRRDKARRVSEEKV